MQLRHLEYFVATADTGTVSGAALAVHVTQPALSRQLRQLETELGVDLFDRADRRLTLSRAGRELLPRARALLVDAEALRADARFLAAGRIERMTIVAPTVTLTDVVAPFVATMPPDDVVVDVRAADAMTTTTMLQDGADLAIGIQRPSSPYVARELAALPVWAFVPPDDPWADRVEVSLGELVTRQLICLPPTFTSRRVLDAAVASGAASHGELLEVASGALAQAMAAAGRGVAVVSDDPRFDLVPLAVHVDGTQLRVRLTVAWHGGASAAPALEDMAQRMAAFVAQRYAGR